ncbi:MAG: dihydroorotase, partial [Tepidimonas taiwanensis]|nr:dihydroorotase [Tepidimonas taiwanensis]
RVLGARLGPLEASGGRLAVGGVADARGLAAAPEWRGAPARQRTLGRAAPDEGPALPGRVRATLVGGHLAFDAGG